MTKRVIVTGAGDSVGRVIAESYLAKNYAVHICDVRRDALEQTLSDNPGLTGTLANIAERDQVASLFQDANVQTMGLDILVNCVGIGGPRGLIEELDDASWRQTFDVNVHGILYTMQYAIPAMKRANKGAILNFSTSSTRTRLPSRTAYVASKFAMEGLTLNAARELGPFGIRCNAIQPGIIDNRRMQNIIRQRANEEGIAAADLESDYLKYVSTRSKISPKELSETVLFLTSDSALNITGELIAVSGNLEWEE